MLGLWGLFSPPSAPTTWGYKLSTPEGAGILIPHTPADAQRSHPPPLLPRGGTGQRLRRVQVLSGHPGAIRAPGTRPPAPQGEVTGSLPLAFPVSYFRAKAVALKI